MNSIMQSYNRNMFMQADIMRFKHGEKRYQEQQEFREEGRERTDFTNYAKLVKQDIASSMFSDTADTQLAPEYKRRFMTGIGTAKTPDTGQVEIPETPSLSRIGKARFQATTYKGESAYEDVKTGTFYKRNPFKAGIKGIGKKFVPGKLAVDEDLAIKYIGKLSSRTNPPDAAVEEELLKQLRENPSDVAQKFILKRDQNAGLLPSLKDILDKYPQDVDRPGSIFNLGDDVISLENARKGIDEYIDALIDYGYTPEEAIAEAEVEFRRLKAEDAGARQVYPKGALPATAAVGQELTRQVPTTPTQTDPLGIR